MTPESGYSDSYCILQLCTKSTGRAHHYSAFSCLDHLFSILPSAPSPLLRRLQSVSSHNVKDEDIRVVRYIRMQPTSAASNSARSVIITFCSRLQVRLVVKKSMSVYMSLRHNRSTLRANSAFSGVYVTADNQQPQPVARPGVRPCTGWLRHCCQGNKSTPPDRVPPE